MATIVLNGRICAHAEISGVERYVANVFSRLQRHGRHRYVVARPNGRLTGWKGHVWEQAVLPLLCRREGAALLFCPSGSVPLASGGIPVVATVLDLSFRWFPKAYSLSFRAFYRVMTELVMRRAARVVAISEAESARIGDVFPAYRRKLKVVHLGIAEEFFQVRRNKPQGPSSVLYVGSLNPRKNIVGLLQAFQMVLKEIPHRLRVVGRTGPQFRRDPELRRFIGTIPDDRLEMLGYVPDDRTLRDLYGEAALFVFPSYDEAFGLPVLEAMAAGVPVVASGIPALREVGGNSVLYCQPQDPSSIAEAILEGIATGASLVEHAKERAREFTWEKCAVSLEAVFDEVLETA